LNERSTRIRSEILAGIVGAALLLSYAPRAAAANPPAETTAGAKPDLATAKKRYAEGERKFKASDFAGALADFLAANEIKSAPQSERYIGLCEDSLGHLPEAASWFDKFLAHVPDKMAAQGEEIRKRDAEIKAYPGKVHIESNPPGATVTVDGKPQPAPTPTDVVLTPGTHTVAFAEQGRLPAEKQVDVAFASLQTLTADLDSAPPPAPPAPAPAPAPIVAAPLPVAPPPPPAEPRSKVPAYVTGALAVAAAGVGTAFGIVALNDKSNFDKNPTTTTADNGDTHALIADMAFGVALTFGVTSAVLFFTKDEPPAPAAATARAPSEKDAKKTRVTFTPTPWVGARSGGAGFVLRF
jgi:hypothetical protein